MQNPPEVTLTPTTPALARFLAFVCLISKDRGSETMDIQDVMHAVKAIVDGCECHQVNVIGGPE